MARDYKHGVGERKEQYQRKSQQSGSQQYKMSSANGLTVIALALSIGFIGGYVVVNHFVTQGAKGEKIAPQTEYVEQKDTLTTVPKNESDKFNNKVPIKEINAEPTQNSVLVQSVVPVEQAQKKGVEYTFYQGLSETEVIVDAEPISLNLSAIYFIQAGSFFTRKQVETEQRRLKKFNLDLNISVLKTKKRIYYRLRLGPFTNRLELNKNRNILRALGVDTLLIKSNKP